MKPRNIVAFTATFLIFIAIILRTTLPLFFTLFLISLLFLSYLLRPEVRIDVKGVPERIEWFQNEEIRLKIAIKNLGNGCILSLSAIEQENFGFRLEQRVIALKQGETKTLDMKVKARIPARLKKFKLLVSSSDPLGFYTFEKEYEIEADIRVLPILEDVRKAKLLPFHTHGLVGNVISRVLGQGIEFHSLREYQSGDPMRFIHWKATAKYSRLITKQFQVERSGDVILCVDLRKAGLVYGREKIQTRIISGAFSLATKVVKNRDRVGAIVVSDAVRYIMPGYGKKQIYRILALLTSHREGDDVPIENLAFILPRLFRTNALFVVFTPLLDDELVSVLVNAASGGFKIVCISPDPLDYIPKEEKKSSVIVRGLLGLKRKSLMAMLSRYMEIMNWRKDVSLASVLRGVRKYRERVLV